MAEIEAVAAAMGMTPTGYLAEAGLAAARGVPPSSLDPAREALASLLAELFDARVALGRVGTNLNQAVAALNATGQRPAWLEHAVVRCDRRIAALDEVVARIGRVLR